MSDVRHGKERTGAQDWHTGSQPEKHDQKQIGARPLAEWTTLAISAAILVSIIAIISWLAFRGAEEPAIITVETRIEEVRQEASGYYLPVVIRNEGDMTVEDAVIQGELDTGTGQPEEVDMTITFLAGGEQVNGTMVFQENPAEGELTVGIASYMEP